MVQGADAGINQRGLIILFCEWSVTSCPATSTDRSQDAPENLNWVPIRMSRLPPNYHR